MWIVCCWVGNFLFKLLGGRAKAKQNKKYDTHPKWEDQVPAHTSTPQPASGLGQKNQWHVFVGNYDQGGLYWHLGPKCEKAHLSWGAVGGDGGFTDNQLSLGTLRRFLHRNIPLGWDGEKGRKYGLSNQTRLKSHLAALYLADLGHRCSVSSFIKWGGESLSPRVIVKTEYRCKASSPLPPPPHNTRTLGSCTQGKIKHHLRWSQRAFPTPLFLVWVKKTSRFGLIGPRGSKAGTEHRTKGQEMDFKLQPCRWVNPGPSLGLSFLQVKHRPRTKCPRVSLAPTVECALAPTSDLQLFSEKQMEYVWLFSMCFFHTLLQNVFLC